MSNLSSNLPVGLMTTIKKTIDRFSLLDNGNDIYVAFSTGKDSLATLLLLSRLGYQTHPVTVNMGDPLLSKQHIENLAVSIDKKIDILDARNPNTFSMLNKEQRDEIGASFSMLDNLPFGEICCTPCYFIKVSAISSFIQQGNASVICFGQHKDDMIVSMLKCYWTDLYYRQITMVEGTPYNSQRMATFMQQQEKIDLAYLRNLVDLELAATDEPFVEYPLPNIKIIRPLGEVAERDIIEFAKPFLKDVHRVDCTFKQNAKLGSFRDLVHNDYHSKLDVDQNLEESLFQLALLGINEDGTLRFRPRNQRGENYPGFKPFIRKI
jgi:tRNA(Ile)-lysidine synthase TilS/MesJ